MLIDGDSKETRNGQNQFLILIFFGNNLHNSLSQDAQRRTKLIFDLDFFLKQSAQRRFTRCPATDKINFRFRFFGKQFAQRRFTRCPAMDKINF
jgi:hypothetical protein